MVSTNHSATDQVAAEMAANGPATDDWEDIRAAVNGGDPQAYGRLVDRYQQEIGAYMWRFSRDRGQWEELVHDVFVDAYFSLPRFKGHAPLLHWLKKIATRVGYRFWKHNRRAADERLLVGDVERLAGIEQEPAANRHETSELVHHLLAQLSPRDRLVMTLMYLETQSIAEIAVLTGWSQTMVKVQAHRARQRLRKICEATGIEP